MSERQAPAPVRGRDRERRAVDVRGVDPEAGGQAADETGLARAELADETEELAAPGGAAERGPEGFGLLGTRGRDLSGPHGRPADAVPRAGLPPGAAPMSPGARR